MKHILMAGLATAATLCAAATAHSATIISPVRVTIEQGGVVNNNPAYAIDNIIDQSGLSKGYEAGVTDFDDYVASGVKHSGALNTEWASQRNIKTSRITFDFGKEVTLFKLALWDENNTSVGRIAVSTPGLGQVFDFAVRDQVGTPYGVSDVIQFAPITTRYLTFDVSGCGDEPDVLTATGCGLGEVVFADGSGVVPEPSTWALMIGGFGMAGAALRQRQRAPARA